jgi:hypothetical protein
VKQSLIEEGAIPCPQGMLQGYFANRPRPDDSHAIFMQLPQRLAANSLRAMARETGSNGRDIFAGGRECSERCRDLSHARILFAAGSPAPSQIRLLLD